MSGKEVNTTFSNREYCIQPVNLLGKFTYEKFLKYRVFYFFKKVSRFGRWIVFDSHVIPIMFD